MKCKNCGAEVGSEYRLCPYCHSEMEYPNTSQPQQVIINNVINNSASQNNYNAAPVYFTQQKSEKSKTVALILCICLGFVGGHCFYAGKIATGILYFFTGGLFV